MTDQNQQSSGVMAALTLGGIVGAALLLLWELFGPSSASVIVGLGDKLGRTEAAWLKAHEQEKAQYEAEIQLAVGQVDTIIAAYRMIYSANTGVIYKAYDFEGKILDRQIDVLDTTQFIDKLGTNVASFACMIGGASTTAQADPELKAFTSNACRSEIDMRDKLIGDYADYLPRHRTRIPKDMIENMPNPDDLISPEFRIIQTKYGNTE